MRFDFDTDQQITRWPTFDTGIATATHGELHTVLYASRDIDIDCFFFECTAFATTFRTGFYYDGA